MPADSARTGRGRGGCGWRAGAVDAEGLSPRPGLVGVLGPRGRAAMADRDSEEGAGGRGKRRQVGPRRR